MKNPTQVEIDPAHSINKKYFLDKIKAITSAENSQNTDDLLDILSEGLIGGIVKCVVSIFPIVWKASQSALRGLGGPNRDR